MEREARPTVRGHKVSHRWEQGREALGLGCFVARQPEARRVGGPDRDLPEPGGGKPRICLSCSQILMHYYFACLSSHPPPSFSFQPGPGEQ